MAITDRERHTHVVCQRAHRPRRKQVPCAGNEALGHGISLFLLPILLALALSLIAVSYVEGSERQSVEERVTQDTGTFRVMEDSGAPRATMSSEGEKETRIVSVTCPCEISCARAYSFVRGGCWC